MRRRRRAGTTSSRFSRSPGTCTTRRSMARMPSRSATSRCIEALTGRLRTGPALTSVYPFVTDLKGRAGAPVTAINSLVTSQNIHVTDEWGTNETNGGSVPQVLPLYTQLALNGGVSQPVMRRWKFSWDLQQDRQPVVPAILDYSRACGHGPGAIHVDWVDSAICPGARSGYRAVQQRLPRHRRIHGESATSR